MYVEGFMTGMEKDFFNKKFKMISFNPFNEDCSNLFTKNKQGEN